MKIKLNKVFCIEEGSDLGCILIDPEAENGECAIFCGRPEYVRGGSFLRLTECKEKFPDGIELKNLEGG